MERCLLEKFKEFLPVTPQTPIITIGEAGTPLVRSSTLENELGCGELYFKLEGCNPTGSFKDRGMVVAVAKAVEEGSMPPLRYRLAHWDSRLNKEEKKVLKEWIDSAKKLLTK